MITKDNASYIEWASLIIFLLFFVIISYPRAIVHYGKSYISIACSDLNTLTSALELFGIENQSKTQQYRNYPTTEEGLNALVTMPNSYEYKNWRRYLEKVPIDPWGNKYFYKATKDSFELFSFGADGKIGGKENNKDMFYPECKPQKSWFEKIFG